MAINCCILSKAGVSFSLLCCNFWLLCQVFIFLFFPALFFWGVLVRGMGLRIRGEQMLSTLAALSNFWAFSGQAEWIELNLIFHILWGSWRKIWLLLPIRLSSWLIHISIFFFWKVPEIPIYGIEDSKKWDPASQCRRCSQVV